jgi:hypothetical protein
MTNNQMTKHSRPPFRHSSFACRAVAKQRRVIRRF